MKKRFSMTLDPELMRKVDRFIDGTKFRNRSQIVEYLVDAGLSQFRPERTAVILCGGLGTRLRPLTFVTPKPMLPVGYQPLLEYLIRYLKRFEFDRVVLAVGYLQEQIVRYFSAGERLGVKILYSFEKEPLDTGGALKAVQRQINSDFLVLNGDVVFDSIDVDRLLYFHRTSGAVATVVLTRRPDVKRYGIVQLRDDKTISQFIEKPKHGPAGENWINAGVYLLKPAIFAHIPSKRRVSLERDVFPKLAEDGKIVGYRYEGYWADLGTPEDYMQVQRDLMTGTFAPPTITEAAETQKLEA
jgi:NDP-sugar pyrophosphorylase family protein